MDEATTFKINGFESLPSVLREYLCAFVLITQSSAKIEARYSKLELNAIEANMANQFYGRTRDAMAAERYSKLFGEKEVERKAHSVSRNFTGEGKSQTTSIGKERIYTPQFFNDLEVGQFVGLASQSNVTTFDRHFIPFKNWEDKEEELPEVRAVFEDEIQANYRNIQYDCEEVISETLSNGEEINHEEVTQGETEEEDTSKNGFSSSFLE